MKYDWMLGRQNVTSLKQFAALSALSPKLADDIWHRLFNAEPTPYGAVMGMTMISNAANAFMDARRAVHRLELFIEDSGRRCRVIRELFDQHRSSAPPSPASREAATSDPHPGEGRTTK